MNILLINHYAGSTRYGMEYRPFYLAREWVKLGHNVTIVGGLFSHLRIQQPPIHGNVSDENIDGIRFVWLRIPPCFGNGLRRVGNMMAFTRKLWRHRAEVLGALVPDAVIVSSPHPFPIFPARRVAAREGAKLIFEVRDLWPLTLIELSGMPRWNPFIQWLQFAENFAYRHADAVVCTLPKAASYMQSHGMAPDKFNYIPNGVCIAEWQQSRLPLPEQHAATLRQLKKRCGFMVGYVGQQSLSNALDSFVEAAPLLAGHGAAIALIGKGPENQRL